MLQGRSAGPPLTLRERSALILLSVSAGAMPSLQPVLLGGFHDAGLLEAGQIGRVAALEALGMAIAIVLAPAIKVLRSPARTASLGIAFLIFGNILTWLAVPGIALPMLRSIAGFGGGLILAVFVAVVSRRADPTREFAIYVTLQALWGTVFAVVVTQFIGVHWGSGGPYLTLGVIDLALLLVVRALPRIDAGVDHAPPSIPPLRGVVGLIGTGLFLCGVMAFWSYAPLLLRHVGGGVDMALAAPLVLGMHVLGGVVAAFASRMSPRSVSIAGPLVLMACIAAMGSATASSLQLLALTVFSLVWMLVPPFHLAMLVRLDGSLSAASYTSSSHLFGIMLGPLLSSWAWSTGGASGVLVAACGALAFAALLPLLAHIRWRGSRRVGASGADRPASISGEG